MELSKKLQNKKFVKIGYSITTQILILSLILILLDYFNIIPSSNKSKYFIIFPIISCLYFFFSYQKYHTNKKQLNAYLIITIISLSVLIANNILNIEIIKQLDYIFYCLIVLSSATYAFSIKNKNHKNTYTISKKIYIPILIIIILLAFFLRISSLTILDPYTDEYYHLSAAQNLDKYHKLDYTRAPIITYSIHTIWKLTDAQTYIDKLFWGRIPGIIFSVLLIIPLFFITKRISTLAGLTASLLWAISPWAIGVAKTIREYAYYPLFVITGIWLLLTLSEYVKPLEEIKKIKKNEYIKLALILLYFVIFSTYAIIIDSDATLKIGLLIFGFVGIYILISKFKTIKSYYNNYPKASSLILFIILSIICLAAYFAVTVNQQTTIDEIEYQSKWSELFLNPLRETPYQWWNISIATPYLIYFLLILGLIISIIQKKYEHLNYLLIFIGTLFFYSFFFNRYFKARYISYLLPIFTILLSLGIASLYNSFLKTKTKAIKYLGIIIITIFLIGIYNYDNTAFTYTSSKHKTNNATSEYHDEVRFSLLSNYSNILTSKDKVITGREQIIEFLFDTDKENIHYYDYRNSSRINDSINFMKNYNNGYIIIDTRRNKKFSKGFPRTNFTYNIAHNKIINITMIQNSGWHVYKWQTNLIN